MIAVAVSMALVVGAAGGTSSVTVPAAPAASAASPPLRTISRPQWDTVPTADQMSDAYPDEAALHDVEGQVILTATANATGALVECKIDSEDPGGHGFADAARKLCPLFRLSTTTTDGTIFGGGTVTFAIRFYLPPDDDCIASFEPAAGESTEPKAVRCPNGDYPDASKAAGHQGVVAIKGLVGADGKVTGSQLSQSSGASELDSAALAAMDRWRFEPGRDGQGKAIAVSVEVKVSFLKDTPDNILSKTCSDFVTDARWFAGAFPGHQRSEMPLYSMVSQIYVNGTMAKGAPIEVSLRVAKKLPMSFDQTFDACVANPQAKFLVTLRDKIQKGL
ncbi:MAG: energy transducer TonB [Caulobacterales bacterium]